LWDANDDGIYFIQVQTNEVLDTGSLSVPAGRSGSFQVAIPTTFVVTNDNDAGPGSLRKALADADAVFPSVDTITFDPGFFSTPRTITLASTLAIGDGVVINGPGMAKLAISGNNANRVFRLDVNHRPDDHRG
jgi:hypothetical protein